MRKLGKIKHDIQTDQQPNRPVEHPVDEARYPATNPDGRVTM